MRGCFPCAAVTGESARPSRLVWGASGTTTFAIGIPFRASKQIFTPCTAPHPPAPACPIRRRILRAWRWPGAVRRKHFCHGRGRSTRHFPGYQPGRDAVMGRDNGKGDRDGWGKRRPGSPTEGAVDPRFQGDSEAWRPAHDDLPSSRVWLTRMTRDARNPGAGAGGLALSLEAVRRESANPGSGAGAGDDPEHAIGLRLGRGSRTAGPARPGKRVRWTGRKRSGRPSRPRPSSSRPPWPRHVILLSKASLGAISVPSDRGMLRPADEIAERR